MRSFFPALFALAALGCSAALPSADDPTDAGSSGADAGVTPCAQTDPLTQRCLDVETQQVACPSGAFSVDHAWLDDAATVRYVANGASGEGRLAEQPAGSIADVIADHEALTVVLGAGRFDVPTTLPASLTVIGRCADESTLSLTEATAITRQEGDSLRLWGVHVEGSDLREGQAAVAYQGAGTLEAHQTAWSSTGDALVVQGALRVERSVFNTIQGAAIRSSGALSSVIVGDNHFLGPISGEGVFLGPISGEGVFRVERNTLNQIAGDAISMTDARSSVIVGDNHFLGPISGEGVFIGPATGALTIQNNEFSGVSGAALMLQELSGGASVRSNRMTGTGDGLGGAGIVVLDGVGSAILVEDNEVSGATDASLIVERTSAEVTIQRNQFTNTVVADEVGGGEVFGYGVLVLDSGAINLLSNTIHHHPTAGVLYDLTQWGAYIRRADLEGECLWNSQDNDYASNGQNEVSQGGDRVAEWVGGQPNPPSSSERALPTRRRQGRAVCGDGQTNGSERCDPNDPENQSVCTEDCDLINEQRSASGLYFSCFIGSDHHVYCVASNQNAPILYPNVDNPEPPNQLTQLLPPTRVELGSRRFVSVAAGSEHACALTIDGEVVCWGQRSSGAVGHCSNDQSSTASAFVTKRLGDNTGRLRHVRSIAAYENTTCAVTHDERVFCWGEHGAGLRAPQAPAQCATQAVSEHPHAPRQVALGNGFACTLSSAGEIACWGTNANLQLGQAGGGSCPQQRTNCSSTALEVPVPQAALLAAGRAACSVQAGSQELHCWGPRPEPPTDRPLPSGASGEIVSGRGGVLPGPIRGVGAVTQLGMGDNHGCVVGDDPSALKCWGAPGIVWSGQAGQPVADDLQAIPPLENGLSQAADTSPILELTVGRKHTCTLRADRKVRCWGYLLTLRGMAIETGRDANGLWGTLP